MSELLHDTRTPVPVHWTFSMLVENSSGLRLVMLLQAIAVTAGMLPTDCDCTVLSQSDCAFASPCRVFALLLSIIVLALVNMLVVMRGLGSRVFSDGTYIKRPGK
jgi:hypothetical protein